MSLRCLGFCVGAGGAFDDQGVGFLVSLPMADYPSRLSLLPTSYSVGFPVGARRQLGIAPCNQRHRRQLHLHAPLNGKYATTSMIDSASAAMTFNG